MSYSWTATLYLCICEHPDQNNIRAQQTQRCSNNVQMLYKCFVFAGKDFCRICIRTRVGYIIWTVLELTTLFWQYMSEQYSGR